MLPRSAGVAPPINASFRRLLGIGFAAALGAASPAHSGSALAPIEPPSRAAFQPAAIARGADLAAIGNCAECHTATGGRPFAGGRPLATPFGTIFGTNITPDPETGIGRWSEEAFRRALREGLDREGRHLYPAFPYDYFTRLSDGDIGAIYAYIMTREPVRAAVPANALSFPFNIRALIGVWKRLFLDRASFQPDPAQNAEWNRGAYLANALGHCGACHTPRNALGAERKGEFFAGGAAEGWHAPALNARSPSPVPWTAERLFAYLRTGLADLHAVPAGPMEPVVRNLAAVPESDVRAIASYVASVMGAPSPERVAHAQRTVEQAARAGSTAAVPPGDARPSGSGVDGKALYAAACGVCHDSGRTTSSAGALPLGLSIAAAIPTPRNLIYIIQDGIIPRPGEPGRYMPAFEGVLTADQLAALVTYIRTGVRDAPPWPNVRDEVAHVLRERAAGKRGR